MIQLLLFLGLILLGALVFGAIGGWALRRARDDGDVDELREAFTELERQVGAAFLPVVQRTMAKMDAWLRRS